MPGSFKEDLIEFFGTLDLYEVLNVSSSADKVVINRAYKRLSLLFHPDKCVSKSKDERELSTLKFQILSKVHKILSDNDKRHLYDETGLLDASIDDFLGTDGDADWYEYWRCQFPKIKIEDIMTFESQYKGSEEELNDLIEAYKTFKGNMDKIMDSVLLATYEDEERFKKILNEEIDKGTIPKYREFTHEPKSKSRRRKNKFLKEAEEAETFKESSLLALIQSNKEKRAKEMNSFLDNLISKYGDEEDILDTSLEESSTSILLNTSRARKKNKKSSR